MNAATRFLIHLCPKVELFLGMKKTQAMADISLHLKLS